MPLSAQHEVGKSCGCDMSLFPTGTVLYGKGEEASHVMEIACHATTVEVYMVVTANDGNTFLEHRSCPRWHMLMMCILSAKIAVIDHTCTCTVTTTRCENNTCTEILKRE